MAKLNQLGVSVVLKVKQLQNLVCDSDKRGFWFDRRLKQLEARKMAIDDGSIDVGDEDKNAIKKEYEQAALMEEDWRGYMLPDDLKGSVLFTRTQLL